MNLLEKIQNIPTPIISVVLILTLTVPMFYPLGLPIKISPIVKAAYDTIEQLPEGSVVLMDYGLTPASVGETGCGARAMVYHMLSKGLKIMFIGGGVDSPQFVEKDVPPIAEILNKKYGTDWVHLGYYAGGETGRAAILSDFNNAYPKDHRGNLLQNLELMKNINNYESIDLVAVVTTGSDVLPMWVRQANTPYGIDIVGSVDGASFSIAVPYFPTQISGLLNALRGGAEYEALMKRPGEAIAGMDSISLQFLVVILLLLITNVAMFLDRKGES
jgi:hypothetical protein